jgi:hypothetical protein
MKNFIIFCLLFLSIKLQAQSGNWTFSNAICYTFSSQKTISINQVRPLDTAVYSFNLQSSSINAFVFPKYHFIPTQERGKPRKKSRDEKPYDLSVGIPLNIGYAFSIGGNGQSSLSYGIGVTGDINIGSCRLESRDGGFGAYGGLGFGVTNTSNFTATNQKVSSASAYNSSFTTVSDIGSYKIKPLGFGPIVHGGVEFGNPNQKIAVHLAYQAAINKNGLDYYTIALQLPFNNMGMRFF